MRALLQRAAGSLVCCGVECPARHAHAVSRERARRQHARQLPVARPAHHKHDLPRGAWVDEGLQRLQSGDMPLMRAWQ